MKKDLKRVTEVEERLKLKGWGEGPLTFLRGHVDTMENCALLIFDRWAQVDKEKANNTGDELGVIATELDALYTDTDAKFAKFKRDHLNDFLKFK